MTKKQNKALQELIRNFKKEVAKITGAELTGAELDFDLTLIWGSAKNTKLY